jgi:hypothetical protein
MESLVEGVEVELLAVGAGVVAGVVGGQIGTHSPEQVETVAISRGITVGTSRLGENARGRWNQMGGPTQECGAKPCLSLWFHHHRRSQRQTTESREYRNWLHTWLRSVFFVTPRCNACLSIAITTVPSDQTYSLRHRLLFGYKMHLHKNSALECEDNCVE